jgi:thermostable 8-oxoguanine DNA glycosylase
VPGNSDKPKRAFRIFNAERDVLEFKFSYNGEETAELQARLNGSTTITEHDLRRVSLWKSNRVLCVSDKTLANLNELSTVEGLTLKDSRVKVVIDDLVLSQGIGFPMASAILKFIMPTLFPIIDVRAYRALTGVQPSYSTYSYDKYISYAEKVTEVARKLNRPLCEIDEQLYCYDKHHNGNI